VARSRTKGKSAGRDAGILEALFANDPEAWGTLVARHAPAVRAVVRLVFDRYHEPVSEDDIDEVVVEVFERVASDRFQWLRALRSPAMVDPSIRTLAGWRTLGLLRSKYRVFTCSLEAEAKVGSHHVATAVLARPPSTKERAPYLTREDVDRLVGEFMEEIGKRPARLLKSVYAFGKSYGEVAERDGIPLASVAQTILEERKRLAEKLSAAAPEAGL
jgi:DNA-directed RNA polymerase specialized sigma24 family protein